MQASGGAQEEGMRRTPLVQGLRRLPLAVAALVGLLLPLSASAAPASGPRLDLPGAVSFESSNYPGHFMRHRNALGELTTMGIDLDRADASWYIRPGLTGAPGSVSFESFNFPGTLLRHQNFRRKPHLNDGSDLLRADATFFPRAVACPQGSCTRYEASNVPGNFIRHSNFELWIAADDGSDLFAQDSAWREVPPQAGTPGTYTMVLRVDHSLHRRSDTYYTDTCNPGGPSPIFDPNAIEVGWVQAEPNGDPCYAAVMQFAVLFGRAPLDQVPAKTINRAALVYDEVPSPSCFIGAATSDPSCWRSGGGAPEPKPDGCVVLRIPSADWPNNPPSGLIPTLPGPSPASPRVGPQEWDVTEPYNWQNTPGAAPLGATHGVGFLLAAGPSLDQLEAEDNTSCASLLSNIRLVVTFTSFDNEPFVGPR
jgi:hypothetical protein